MIFTLEKKHNSIIEKIMLKIKKKSLERGRKSCIFDLSTKI